MPLHRQRRRHLAPQLSQLLTVDLDLDGPLSEVLLELGSCPEHVLVAVVVELADEHAVPDPLALNLHVVLGEHEGEGLCLVVDYIFGQSEEVLLVEFPFVDVELLVELLLASVQVELVLGELLLQLLLLLEDLEVTVQVIPHILEEGVEVLLHHLEVSTQDAPPLDRQVVHRHVEVVQFA